MTESELMKDFDAGKHAKRYCIITQCTWCDGIDENGEPNGYGCTEQDEYVHNRYKDIFKRRLKKQVAKEFDV